MDYTDLGMDDQAKMIRAAVRQLEAAHFGVTIDLVANRHVRGADLDGLRQKQAQLSTAMAEMRKEFAVLLAETEATPTTGHVEAAEPAEVEA